jgi:hypothetical protein
MGRRVRGPVAGILLAVALMLGCAAPAVASTDRSKEKTSAAQYLAATKQTSTDQRQFYASMTTAPILSVVTKRATNLATAYTKFAGTLNHIHWKGKAKSDARAFETYLRSFAQFLLTVKDQTPSTMSSWSIQLTAIGNAGHKPFDALSHALGLRVNAVTPGRGTAVAPTTTTSTTTTTTVTAPPPPPVTTTTPPPPPTTTPPPVAPSCTPLTDGGNCYEPGEYCRDDDHGVTGVAGNGETITCEDNDGWRWEPT